MTIGVDVAVGQSATVTAIYDTTGLVATVTTEDVVGTVIELMSAEEPDFYG